MKIEFIKRGAATRLILIFAGWSTDARYYSDCTVEGWDTAVVSDYRDMTMPSLPEQYATVYVFAYSLGVAAASACAMHAAARIAICGSGDPVSDIHGIPEGIYSGTVDGLDERTLMKFHIRMAGDRSTFDSIKTRLSATPDIEGLKEELASIRTHMEGRESDGGFVGFDRAYIADEDRIFPYSNLRAFWERHVDTELVTLKGPHAVDIASIVRKCLPDTAAIGNGFACAVESYKENAVVQKEICGKIAEKLASTLKDFQRKGLSLLEIGAGNGLLTDEWRRLLAPEKATYVDLTDMPDFRAAKEERYVKADAELWLEKSGERFDIILSASTMQWFADPVRFISNVRTHLNHGGFAILSTFVKGNLRQLDALRPAPLLYRTVEDYSSASSEIVEDWERTLQFRTAAEMMIHLRLTGVSPRRKKGIRHENGCSDINVVKQQKKLPLELTYHPLILFIKP